MTDYTKLVDALRCENTGDDECGSSDCTYWSGLGCMDGQLMEDAADAIEELKDMPWVESVQVDKLRQRIDELEETACHCNVRENAELIAKILDDDVDGKVYQMPKRGEWIDGDARRVTARCSVCGHLRLGNGAEWANKHVHFCEVCGSRMGDEKA